MKYRKRPVVVDAWKVDDLVYNKMDIFMDIYEAAE